MPTLWVLSVLVEVPDKRLMSARRLSQLRVIIHFTVSADERGCLCVLLEHKGRFNVSINILPFSGNSEQLRNNSEVEGTRIKSEREVQ